MAIHNNLTPTKLIFRYEEKENHEMDVYNSKKQFERELSKLKRKRISRKTKEKILAYLEKRKAEGISYVQLLKDIQSIKIFFEVVKKDLRRINEKDLVLFLNHQENLSPKTRKIRWYCLKKFLEFCGKDKLFDKFEVKFERKRSLLPEEILSEEEVERMIREARGKNKVFIAILYESGMRISELLTRKVKDVFFDEKGAIILVDGKTGKRRVRIVKFASLLREFIKFKSREERIFNLSYANARKILKETALKCGITKRVYPHLFRHSRATHLANFLTEAQLKEFFGWSQSSEMASIYVHLSGRDIDEAILRMNERKRFEYIG